MSNAYPSLFVREFHHDLNIVEVVAPVRFSFYVFDDPSNRHYHNKATGYIIDFFSLIQHNSLLPLDIRFERNECRNATPKIGGARHLGTGSSQARIQIKKDLFERFEVRLELECTYSLNQALIFVNGESLHAQNQ